MNNHTRNLIYSFVIMLINVALLFTLMMVFQPGLAAPQTVITVNSTADVYGGSDCTLRNAIYAAQTNSAVGGCPAGSGSGTDVIELTAGATYSLSIQAYSMNGWNAFPLIVTAITINGNGATIRRDESVSELRLFYVHSGGALTLNDLIIRDFYVDSIGAAINAFSGPLTVTNCTFSQNTSTSSGGAISLSSNVTKISESSFFDNYSDYAGGAIQNYSSTTYITNTTFYSNSAKYNGGGISIGTGWITLTNASFSANVSGISIYGHSLAIGGSSGTPTISYRNSIMTWSGTGYNCRILPNYTGFFNNGGGNIVYPSDTYCAGTVANPNLGTYQDNGGPTNTLALLADSPAIDTAQDSVCPATDQRGFNRPIDGDGDGTAHCDIGAYEYPFWFYFPVIMR